MNYVELQACPICGAHPEKDVVSLEKPGGRGYAGCYTYQYKCEKCGLVKGKQIDDIYRHKAVAQNDARGSWNEEVNRIRALMRENKNENQNF